MLQNAFSPLPSPSSQPETPSIFLRNAFGPLPQPSKPASTQSSKPRPQPVLSRAASDLLASGISASTLLGAAYESLTLLHTAIHTTTSQRQSLLNAGSSTTQCQPQKPGSQALNRAGSFSRPRSVGPGGIGSTGVEKGVEELELEQRLGRLAREEEVLRRDIEYLKGYIEHELLGGKHHREFSAEMLGDEGVEKNAKDDDQGGLDSDEGVVEKVVRGQDLPSGRAV